jgi:di/tricarboxylate transporter
VKRLLLTSVVVGVVVALLVAWDLGDETEVQVLMFMAIDSVVALVVFGTAYFLGLFRTDDRR